MKTKERVWKPYRMKGRRTVQGEETIKKRLNMSG